MSGFAGSDLAGDDEAGFGAGDPSMTPRAVVPPHALFLDPVVMDFTTVDGLYQEVHPVDHQVEMRLAVALGSSPSAPETGSGLRSLKLGSRKQMTIDAHSIVDTALASLIANGDVRIASVTAYAANAWRAHVDVVYYNLRAPDADRSRSVVVN